MVYRASIAWAANVGIVMSPKSSIRRRMPRRNGRNFTSRIPMTNQCIHQMVGLTVTKKIFRKHLSQCRQGRTVPEIDFKDAKHQRQSGSVKQGGGKP